MPKKTSAKSRAKKGTTRRKLLDLPIKTVRGGEAESEIKGGLKIKMEDILISS